MENVSTVCFTGHRNIQPTSELKDELKEHIEQLVEKGAILFLSGAARGWDLLCASAVLELKEKYPHIKLRLVLPCPAREQTKGWNDAELTEYKRISDRADEIEACSDHYFDGCMKQRNQRLVELADICICYYNEKNFRSGTGQTVRMAERKRIKIKNFFIP